MPDFPGYKVYGDAVGPFEYQGSAGHFGHGLDGAVTFDGAATVLGIVPAGGVYILNRDIFLTSGVVTGCSVLTVGYRIFCTGTFNVIAGATVRNLGGPAGSGSDATSYGTNALFNGVTLGGAGGTGGPGGSTANGAGTGFPQTGPANTSRGGAGGAGSTSAGGTAGTTTPLTELHTRAWQTPPATYRGWWETRHLGAAPSLVTLQAATSGGGGGGDGANAGGGGGVAGGFIVISARELILAGTLNARGGAGGNAVAGNCGGGGGGGGGSVLLTYHKFTNTGTFNVNGGAGGAKTGTGIAGSAGNTGTVIQAHI